MKIEPFGERLIVKRLSEKERSGIVIPKESSIVKGSLVGRVVHCGPSADFVAEGDVVLFAKYSGTELPVDGKYLGSEYEDCICMNEENILGKLSDPVPQALANAIPCKEVENVA